MEQDKIKKVDEMKNLKPFLAEKMYANLPEVLRNVIQPYKGRERDIVLLSSIGVLSNCLPNIFTHYDGRLIYSHLYILIIAPPASGKGVMAKSRLLIEKIHNEKIDESTKKRSRYLADKGEKPLQCPIIELKILPANSSTAAIYKNFKSSKEGLLIFETEADTMGNMLKNDWSNYSDVMRKAFHNEPISENRLGDGGTYNEVKEPKLAIVMSGTPKQLAPIIQSKENGLYSRFIVYNFEELASFKKDVFSREKKNIDEIFKKEGDKIYELYKKLEKLEKPIEIALTKQQQEEFINYFDRITEWCKNQGYEEFNSNVFRNAIIMLKLIMIFSVLRNIDHIAEETILECSEVDFKNALCVVDNSLMHTLYIFKSMEDIHYLNQQDEEILDKLPTDFMRFQVIEAGKSLGVAERTLDDKLKQWSRKKIVKRISKGRYLKN
ncbi:DUF3987 domain-containing protein [Capnocytophaga sp. ARDL2]|uniref:DUF3987 domain-containing protein n=1 Tax=Capnocytophaga sp. ARDL2 TaxID=3238809 RepID=UPI003558BD8D